MGVTADLPFSRSQMGALVSRLLATNPVFAEQFPHRDGAGRRIVIPVLGTDSVHHLTRLVRQSGGTGSFVVLYHDSEPGSFCLTIGSLKVSDRVDEDDHHVPVTPDCTVGDLMRVLLPGARISYELAGNELYLEGVTTQEVADPAMA
jgi:hypothetical protein